MALADSPVPTIANYEDFAFAKAVLGRILGDLGKFEDALVLLEGAIDDYELNIEQLGAAANQSKSQLPGGRSSLGSRAGRGRSPQ